ncbi:phosphoglycolate phosphatase [Altererythrobacter xiamenensis]|uniref:Phosphoglycolate phosphatase n=1 Tax=Altererythrobacter xiamenensis TaxID=1316679 RepID=A0A1Y6EI69_9SPHN|nr:HAD-IA family hydrolase [Altererythrobacter xiamenensis]SMQ62304.1 phosphoglycolate phosphatase [Altererythrobacter xiamenensis]
MTRLAVFDCDGTLVDGQASVCNAMRDAFEGAGKPCPDLNEVRRIVGLSLPVAIRSLAPDLEPDENARIVAAYKESFFAQRQQGLVHEPLYDGMAELLHRLHDGGWKLAVATGKSDRGLHACLDQHGIKGLFVSLQTADRHPSKPHPAMLEAALFEAGATPEQSVMIGDTSFDMIMATDANVRALGVAWGYHSPDELHETGAVGVANTMEELEALL